MLDRLDALGLASVEAFWLPILAWTLMWGGVALALRLGLVTDAASRYRAAQATLLALPAGLALASVLDLTGWVPVSIPAFDPASALAVSLPADLGPVLADAPAPASSVPVFTFAMGIGALGVGLALVALVQLMRLGAQVGAVWRLRRALPLVKDHQIDADAEAARGTVGLRRDVEVIVTSAAVVPMTLGVWRPVVIIPHSLHGDARRLALAHEFMHVHQLDPLMQALESLVAAVFGWHPAVRRLSRQADLLREMACDAHVLADDTVSRSAYATLLASFLTPPVPATVPVGLGLADSLPDVHQRLLAMRTPSLSRPSTLLGWALALTLLVGGSLTMTAGSALAQQSSTERQRAVEAEQAAAERVVRTLRERQRAVEAEAEDAEVVVGTLRQRAETDRNAAIHAEIRALEARLAAQKEAGEYEAELEASVMRLRGLRAGLQARQSSMRAVEIVEIPEQEADLRAALAEARATLDASVQEQEVVVGTLRRMTDSVRVVELHSELRAMKERAAQLQADVSVAEVDAARSALRAAEAELERQPVLSEDGFQIQRSRLNLSADELALDLVVPTATTVRVEMFDLSGRRVLSKDAQLSEGTRTVRLNVRGLASGMYIYRAQMADGTYTASRRLTIAR